MLGAVGKASDTSVEMWGGRRRWAGGRGVPTWRETSGSSEDGDEAACTEYMRTNGFYCAPCRGERSSASSGGALSLGQAPSTRITSPPSVLKATPSPSPRLEAGPPGSSRWRGPRGPPGKPIDRFDY